MSKNNGRPVASVIDRLRARFDVLAAIPDGWGEHEDGKGMTPEFRERAWDTLHSLAHTFGDVETLLFLSLDGSLLIEHRMSHCWLTVRLIPDNTAEGVAVVWSDGAPTRVVRTALRWDAWTLSKWWIDRRGGAQ